MKRAFLAALAALAIVVAMASPSYAVTGGNIFNSSLSVSYVNVYIPSGAGVKIVPGDNTTRYALRYNVAKFMVPGVAQNGVPRCAKSQYSPSGSCPYRGGVLYNDNGLQLKLTIYEIA